MTLSILIPTLPRRQAFLDELLFELDKQIQGLPVEIIVDDRLEPSTGEKRNWLISQASGEYVWQVDDDDLVLPGAISAILKALESKPDCLAINGIMTTDGNRPEKWEIAIQHPYEKRGNTYYRHPNHITPMKRVIAQQVKFQHIVYGEDYAYACALKKLGLLKTQVVVDIPVYHYRVRTNKKV